MDVKNSSGVYVFSERQDVRLELLSVGRELAEQAGAHLGSILIGPNTKVDADEQIAHGADEVLMVHNPRLERIQVDLYAEALWQAIQHVNLDILLMGATKRGKEIAARLAQRLKVGCASDGVSLKIENGDLVVEKRYYGGKFLAKRLIQARPRMVTIQPRKFEAPPRDSLRKGRIEALEVQLKDAEAKVIKVEPTKRSGIEIGKAEIIVSVGRGLRRAEDLSIIQELANTLGAAVGASRPLTQDLQWLPVDVQVGLSGTTVQPKLYIACGISGQIEHIVGMRSSTIVVAINKDPNAPIFQEADYCIVGDLYEIIPALTRAFKRMLRK